MQIYRNVKTGHTSFHCYFPVTRKKRCLFRFQKGIPKHSPPRLRAFAKTIHSQCRGRSACCLIPGAVQWTMLSLFKHLNYTGEACLLIHRIIELGQLTLDSLAFSLTAHCTLLICINEQNVEGVDQFIQLDRIVSADSGIKFDANRRINYATSMFRLKSDTHTIPTLS